MDDSAHSSAEMISMERSTHTSSSSYQPPSSTPDSDQVGKNDWAGAVGKMVGLVQEAPRLIYISGVLNRVL